MRADATMVTKHLVQEHSVFSKTLLTKLEPRVFELAL